MRRSEYLLEQSILLLASLLRCHAIAQDKQDGDLLMRILCVSDKAHKRYWRRRGKWLRDIML